MRCGSGSLAVYGEEEVTSPDSPDQPRPAAVEQLRALGLSTYAARTFVALVGLGGGTAQDVSEAADVPRTRVYDAVEELDDSGLVDVQYSTPRRFHAVSAETASRQFRREYDRRVTVLTEALDEVATDPDALEQRGVWTVTGREAVSERVRAFVDEATEEVVYMTDDSLLGDDLVAALDAASDRGVTIRLGGMSRAAEATLREAVPEAEPVESLWDWSATPAGRLLLVDGETTLVSVLVSGDGDHPPKPRDETAIWGTGETNGLVVVLRTTFAPRQDGAR